ncbi:MAG: hypothetical protein KKE71_03600, partial [Nanoarchaeota archaeon]|nr:hypothetical protein [Nanoarchaeota archaeon]
MTQENFNRIAERHNKMFDRMELTKAVRQAIVDKDYAAYQLAAANLANSNNAMTAEEFNAVANGSTEQGFGGRFGHKGGFGGNCMRGQ